MDSIFSETSDSPTIKNKSSRPFLRRPVLPSKEALVSAALFLARRLAFAAVVLLAIIFLTYWGMLLVQSIAPLPAAGQAGRQTLQYLIRLLQGDLGMTQRGSVGFGTMPVSQALLQVAPRSLGLLAAAMLVSVALGVPLGAAAAARRNSRWSLALIIISIVGISMPSFFAALLLQILAIRYTRAFGTSLVPVGGFGWDAHLVLPMLVLAARPVAQITRIAYVSLSESLDQDYIRTARSKGLRHSYIFWIHAFRNAAVPILITIAVSLSFSLSSLPVVEVYFGWGGIGVTLLNSLFSLDADLTIALFLVLGILFLAVNLLLEIGQLLIDPRLRQQEQDIILRRSQTSFRALTAEWLDELRFWVLDNPLFTWMGERWQQFIDIFRRYPAEQVKAEREAERAAQRAEHPNEGSRWRAWRRGITGNLPLVLGILIVGGLLFLTLYGPRLAPYSPNTTQVIAIKDGQMTTPPFPPDDVHPWGTDPMGRDMQSLILAGVQQTMILALLVVGLRLLLGFVLGVLAGWFNDSWLDRTLLGLRQAIAVFPTLLLAALLIFIFGIETGMRAFVLALALVGWGEIMLLVRGQVLTIRPRPYIESAVAVGQRTSRLILMHVLPGLAGALISVAALEAGAVLLLLGELGFLGIFLQGGAGSELGLYSQVPEWGALLSGVRTWTRSFPWTGFFPTSAFFIAILGFNLLGEGLRRLVDEVGLVVNRLFNRYTFFAGLLLVGAFYWSRGNTGELVFYRQQADTYIGQNALDAIRALTGEAYTGRALGSSGTQASAEYIADEFRRLGLQPAGSGIGFYQEDVRTYAALQAEPQLTLNDGGATPDYLQEYVQYPSPYLNQGSAQGAVRYLALGAKASPEELRLDLSQDIVLIPGEAQLPQLSGVSCRGVLVIAADLNLMKRRYTYSADPAPQSGCGLDTPVLWVSERLANRMLEGSGESLRTLTPQLEDLGPLQSIDLPLSLQAEMDIRSRVEADVPIVNVLGYLPGTSEELDNQMIVVAAQYDTPPQGLGAVYPGANDNASGVAVMLETIRTMQESGYQPFKTFLFVAYSGEGLPDLAMAPEIRSFLEAKTGFANAYDIEATIFLRGLGAGQGDTLAIYSPDKYEVTKTLESAAHLTDMKTERVTGPASMNVFQPKQDRADLDIPQIGIARQGWERSARLLTDNVDFMRSEDLAAAGRAITLGLMILGR